MQALDNAVNADQLVNLVNLNLSGCLTNDADVNSAVLETFLKSLENHCPHLDSLKLSDNNLGVPGASVIAAAISRYFNVHTSPPYDFNDFQSSAWLSSIDLNNTNLGDEGLIAFIEKLDCPYHFDNLELKNNGILATGLNCLAKKISSDSRYHWMDQSDELESYSDYPSENCVDLDLSDNPIGLDGVIAVGEVLHYCDQPFVDLSRCHLTTTTENINNPPNCDYYDEHTSLFKEVGSKRYQMQGRCNVRCLTLDGNCFTAERIHILAGFIHICGDELQFLSINDCNITSDDLIQLIEILLDKSGIISELQSLSLCINEIDDRGVSALMHHMPSDSLFPSLGKRHNFEYVVDLGRNPVSREMVERLEEMLYPPLW